MMSLNVQGCRHATLSDSACVYPWLKGMGNLLNPVHDKDKALQLLAERLLIMQPTTIMRHACRCNWHGLVCCAALHALALGSPCHLLSPQVAPGGVWPFIIWVP